MLHSRKENAEKAAINGIIELICIDRNNRQRIKYDESCTLRAFSVEQSSEEKKQKVFYVHTRMIVLVPEH